MEICVVVMILCPFKPMYPPPNEYQTMDTRNTQAPQISLFFYCLSLKFCMWYRIGMKRKGVKI